VVIYEISPLACAYKEVHCDQPTATIINYQVAKYSQPWRFLLSEYFLAQLYKNT